MMLHESDETASETRVKADQPSAALESREAPALVQGLPLGQVGRADQRACPECSVAVPVERGPDARYCSVSCRQRWNRKKRPDWSADGRVVSCERCHGDIEMDRLRNQAGRTRFCGGCAPSARAARTAKKAAQYRDAGVTFPSNRSVASPFRELVAGDVGALSEMMACADLIRRGFHVFRAVSPSAPCDLVAVSEAGTYRVEVKTAGRRANGRVSKPKIAPAVRVRYDVVAYVVHDGEIVYEPEWPKVS